MNIDFMIVGAMKAGTSSLAFHLNNHPDIYLPEQELQFFNNDKEFSKGYEYYLSLYKPNNEKILGEKTPTYSYQENVMERIYNFNPEIKLIWILRNPVDRAYSNYLHAVKEGVELLTFDEAVRQEPERIKTDIWKGYLERSIYVKQINRYLKRFKKEQMHFLLFENLNKNPEVELEKVFNFLGVNPNTYILNEEVHNKTILPWSARSVHYTRKVFGYNSFILNVIKKINTLGKAPGYPKLPKKKRKELELFFLEYNKNLQSITELDLSIWRAK